MVDMSNMAWCEEIDRKREKLKQKHPDHPALKVIYKSSQEEYDAYLRALWGVG